MDVPGILLTATIWSYWIGVGAMIVRVRRHTRRVIGVVPEQQLERLMWLVWVPLVAAWCVLPWLALQRAEGPFALPAFARDPAWYSGLRWIAALVGAACLAATIKCWAHMGKDWRMAVTAEPEQALITDGLFARIRHPIYAFSILLMLCTMVVVPTPFMLAFGAVHVVLMVVKARNEERHMLARRGAEYAQYLARTGRFLPRFR